MSAPLFTEAAANTASNVAKMTFKERRQQRLLETQKRLAERGFEYFGKKEVYLPNHVVTFLRPKPNQPPTTATFKVPLTFNKFDFRDYLWNVYNVGTNSVRSFVLQPRPEQRNLPGKHNGQWYRPRAEKIMIVDMVKPFTWPERPTNLEPWDNKLFTTVEDGQNEFYKKMWAQRRGTPALRNEQDVDLERGKLRKLAKDVLAGNMKWIPERGGWVDLAKEREQQEEQERARKRAEKAAEKAAKAGL